jgi:hypothetical protein
MNRFMTLLLPLFAAGFLSNTAFAKGPTVKVTIRGGDLQAPIEITDVARLAPFSVWSGPGVAINGAADLSTSFADWKHRAFPYQTQDLPHFEVYFYVKLPEERLVYAVTYAYDSTTGRGFIHVPGGAEPSYPMNVRTIFRGVEGEWFQATSAWDSLIGPLLADRLQPASSPERP